MISTDTNYRDTVPPKYPDTITPIHVTASTSDFGNSQKVPLLEVGKLIFDIEQSDFKYCIIKESVKVSFYEKILLVKKTTNFLCYPETFTQISLPKYRIVGVKFLRPKISFRSIILSLILIIVGASLIGSNGVTSSSAETSFDDQQQATTETGENTSGIISLVVGICLLLYSLIIPCYSRYTIRFSLSQPKVKTANSNFSCSHFFCSACFPYFSMFDGLITSDDVDDVDDTPKVIEIETNLPPDINVILNYVYGTLAENMDRMHALVHLLEDEVMEAVKPSSLRGAIGDEKL